MYKAYSEPEDPEKTVPVFRLVSGRLAAPTKCHLRETIFSHFVGLQIKY